MIWYGGRWSSASFVQRTIKAPSPNATVLPLLVIKLSSVCLFLKQPINKEFYFYLLDYGDVCYGIFKRQHLELRTSSPAHLENYMIDGALGRLSWKTILAPQQTINQPTSLHIGRQGLYFPKKWPKMHILGHQWPFWGQTSYSFRES